MTLGNTEDIDHFVLVEDRVDSDFLFELLLGEVDLIRDGTTIDLDFHNVSLLLSEVKVVHLGLDDKSDNRAVFLDSVELSFDLLLVPAFSVFGESLLLGVHPVLVKSSLEFSGQMLGPNSAQSSMTSGSIDVTNNTANGNSGGFEDSASFNNFLLVDLGSRSVNISQDVSHTGLEDGEGGKVDGLGSVILGEGSNSSSVMSSSLSGKETKRTVSRSFEFSVRHTPKSNKA